MCLAHGVAGLAVAVLALGAGADRPPGTGRVASNPIGEVFPLVFDSESIWLSIVGDSLEVRGTYTLLCRGPIEESIPLFFPFPIDSLPGGARMVSLAFRVGADPSAPATLHSRRAVLGARASRRHLGLLARESSIQVQSPGVTRTGWSANA